MADIPLKDYYAVLGVSRHSSQEEIKAAYRVMSKRWHPDVNPNVDVTHMMQAINEAYAILKDDAKRARYDCAYDAYFTQTKRSYSDAGFSEETGSTASGPIEDEELKQDIRDAREYAEHFVSEFFANLKDTSQKAAKGAWDESKGYVYVLIISTVIGLLIMACL